MTPSAPTMTALFCIPCLAGLTAWPVLTTGILNELPPRECSLDREKVFMFGVFGMFLGGSARPGQSPAACWANGVFRKNLGQCIRELLIEDRNVGAAGHGFTPCPEGEDTISLLTAWRWSLWNPQCFDRTVMSDSNCQARPKAMAKIAPGDCQ